MDLIVTSEKTITDYLTPTEIINCDNSSINTKSVSLTRSCQTVSEKAKMLFEFVRDTISHSFDIQNSEVTFVASDVLEQGHGICFAKAHLLAAMCRAVGIPAGFCYQKLIFDDTIPNPYFTLHGLNAIYLDSYKRWIRLDSRGNKPGVVSEFNLEKEQLAFYVRPELGEEDYMEIYAEPEPSVIQCLSKIDHWNWKSMDKQLPNKPTPLINPPSTALDKS
jgi:transglutaminase-like putative cysteine protease